MEHVITVVGMGPGSPDYVLPAAQKAIERSQVLVGSQRILATVYQSKAKRIIIESDLVSLVDSIKTELLDQDVTVLVSGDPGFFSLLSLLKKHFGERQIQVIPGISSMQVAWARIGEVWQDATWSSFHGRIPDQEQVKYFPKKRISFLLDPMHPPAYIAEVLQNIGWPKESEVHLFARLSYEDEKYCKMSIGEVCFMTERLFDHGIMVVIDR